MLYRIAEAADWQRARQTGFFASADLAAEGFIHSSEPHQILETARRYYAGRADLVLLEIDEDALTRAGGRVAREWVASRQQHFARVFGAVPLAAVRRTWPFGVAANGQFELPAELKQVGVIFGAGCNFTAAGGLRPIRLVRRLAGRRVGAAAPYPRLSRQVSCLCASTTFRP